MKQSLAKLRRVVMLKEAEASTRIARAKAGDDSWTNPNERVFLDYGDPGNTRSI
jgi:hypothetical protein